MAAGRASAAIVPLAAGAAAGGPPASPPWPSPSPSFPSSWFGANMESLEVDDPQMLATLRKYKQVFASWPEKVLATNFTNATLVAVDDATRMKASLGKGTSVCTYQSQWVAAAYYPEARALMEDPQFSDFFLKNGTGQFEIYDGYCSQVHVSAADYPTCIGYYWNWCNDTAVDYYVNKVLRAMVADPSGEPYAYDCMFLDNSEGFSTRGASNAKCDPHVDAKMNVHIQTAKLLQKFGKWPVLSGGYKPATTEQLWAAGVGFSKFYEYFTPTNSSIAGLLADTAMGLPTVVHAPNSVKRHPGVSSTDAIAAFLVAAGGASHSYFQYSTQDWTHDNQWPWSTLYEAEYGKALPVTVTLYGPNMTGTVWVRKFSSGAVATVNCTPPSLQPRFEWCHGNVTVPGQ